MKKLLLTLLIVVMAVSCFAKKNVILMIGDGMGINSVFMAEQYTGKKFDFTKWKTRLFCTTYSESVKNGYEVDKAWEDVDRQIPNVKYLISAATDSAAAATALNSSIKTINGKVNYSGDDRYRFIPFGQLMKAMGYGVGSITTVTWYDATPSGPFGHGIKRGSTEVAYDMLTHPIDVLGGTGNPYYNGAGVKRDGKPSYGHFISKDLWDIVANGEYGYKLLSDSESIKALAKEKNPKGPYYLCVPATGDLGYMKVGELSKDQYKGVPDDIVTLADMSLSALNVLKENEKGFYLMIEGGAIDHGNHANNWKHSVCQTVSFAEAIDAVCKWVEKNSSWEETSLIITADHQTGGLINADGSYFVKGNKKGEEPKIKYTTGGHSLIPVPFFVKGANEDKIWDYAKVKDPVFGPLVDNTDVMKFFGDFIGVKMPQQPTAMPKFSIDYDPFQNAIDKYNKFVKAAGTNDGKIKDLKLEQENWKFVKDDKAVGDKEKWYADASVFDKGTNINVKDTWEQQGYENYDGEGWYYKTITLTKEDVKKKRLMLCFNMCDEQAWVYVNGKLAGERTYASTGKTGGEVWDKPFMIDIAPFVKEGDNTIIIKASDDAGAGGISCGVMLYATDEDYL